MSCACSPHACLKIESLKTAPEVNSLAKRALRLLVEVAVHVVDGVHVLVVVELLAPAELGTLHDPAKCKTGRQVSAASA